MHIIIIIIILSSEKEKYISRLLAMFEQSAVGRRDTGYESDFSSY